MRLPGKVAIITGAATGIGQAMATAFAAEGAAVAVDYVGPPGASDQTLERIKAAGGRGIAVAADVSNPSQVAALIDQTVRAFGRLDVFVNNAGIEFKHPFLEFPLEQFQKIVAVNLQGPFLCAQAAARQMVQQGAGGRIINIS